MLEYIKTYEDLAKKPKGLHAVVSTTDENPEGVIFVLRNINNSINIDNQNRIHPLCEKFNKETDDGYNMGRYHSFCLMPEIRGAGRAQEAVAKADSNTAGEGTPGEAAE